MNMLNADPAELEKFGDLAHHWWDPNSEFKPLHDINPLRLDWIDQATGLAGKRILDVGCGGGLLSEGMAIGPITGTATYNTTTGVTTANPVFTAGFNVNANGNTQIGCATANSATSARTDRMVVIRYLFGLRGTALVLDAVGC